MEPVTDGKHLNEHDCALKAILILFSIYCIMLSILLTMSSELFCHISYIHLNTLSAATVI